MNTDSTLSYVNSNHLLIELSTDTLERVWQKSQAFSSKSSRWQAYRNQACLSGFLPWLREQIQGVELWPNRASLPSFWEVVNGVAISFNQQRLVLIPTDNLDLSELRVPQEWIDLPSWAADKTA